jgi:hypothetical protein
LCTWCSAISGGEASDIRGSLPGFEKPEAGSLGASHV